MLTLERSLVQVLCRPPKITRKNGPDVARFGPIVRFTRCLTTKPPRLIPLCPPKEIVRLQTSGLFNRRGMERQRLSRGVIWLLVVGALLTLFWFAIDLTYVANDNETDYAAPADVIIVLGCPSYEGNVASSTFSPCLQARARHAAELYLRGLASHTIPTGGLTGPPPSEAVAITHVLLASGVPSTAITLEEQALDTVQNIQYSRTIMRASGWRTAILVTEPHHIKRATLIARDAGLTVYPSPATDSTGWHNPDARQQSLLRDAVALMTYQLRHLLTGPP